MNVLKKFIACIFICILFFGAGFIFSEYRRTNNSKPESNIIDTSAIDRISELARSGLVEQRKNLDRERSEFESERIRTRNEIAGERKRIAREREIDFAERERITSDRAGIAEIERRCQETIRIVEKRATDREN